MNVYFRELRANLKSFLFWCLGMFLMVAGGMGKYAGYSGSEGSINDLIKSMPRGLKALFGGLDVSTMRGFYAMLFLYILLLAAIHAAMLGAGIISKEERDRTTEFLFAKPMTRVGVITAKLLASLSFITGINVFTLFVSIGMTNAMNGHIEGEIAKLSLGMFLAQLIFLSIGTAIAAALRRPKAASAIAAGVILLTFFLSVGVMMNEDFDFLKYFTPFQYFDAEMLVTSGFKAVYLLLTAAIVGVLTALTYVTFKKKDLSI